MYVGNHELEPQGDGWYFRSAPWGLDGGRHFNSYLARLPVSRLAEQSGGSPLYYSVEVGPVHMVHLFPTTLNGDSHTNLADDSQCLISCRSSLITTVRLTSAGIPALQLLQICTLPHRGRVCGRGLPEERIAVSMAAQ